MEEFKTVNSNVLKSINRTLIKECFENGTACSKQKAAELTQTSFPTASHIIDEMVHTGELLEAGQNASSGGRRAALYVLNPEYEFSLTVTIQYKKIIFTVYNALGVKVTQTLYVVKDELYIQVLFKSIQEYKSLYSLSSVLIGVPGCVAGGKIFSIDLYDSLKSVHLKNQIETKFQLPAVIENDVNAAALGYYTQVKGQNASSETTACVYISENGPGCGLLMNGEIIHGSSGFAGELGYMVFENRKTFQQVAINKFADIDIASYVVRLTAAIIAFINPQKILFYKNDILPSLPVDFTQMCCQYIPEYAMPDIILSEDFIEHYELGLRMLGKNVSRETFYQLLQRKP